MSYGLTDAGEEDMKRELKTLEELSEEIDQLASEARGCATIAPQVKQLLDLAWWFAEEAVRDARGHCSAGCSGQGFCPCCHHFKELIGKAGRIRAVLR